jgi:hypothetical protein
MRSTDAPPTGTTASWWTTEAQSLVMPALFSIPRRAERQSGEGIRRTFVDVGALATSLASREHQVIFGRRGTGKTHALENLAESLRGREQTVITVDLRTIGSAGAYYLTAADGIPTSATRIIVDLLESVHQQILEECVRLIEAGYDVTALVHHLDQLGEASCAVEVVGTTEVVSEDSASRKDHRSIMVQMIPKPVAGIEFTDDAERARSRRRAQSGVEQFSLKFGPVARSLAGIVRALPSRSLWLILDEWSALPLAVQPLVADFLRRCFLPLAGTVVKIGAIQGRSQFSRYGGGAYLGIELGADMTQDLDLDQYLSGNTGNRHAEEFFSDLFCRHISEYWRGEGQELSARQIRGCLIAAIPDFPYLVMAGGGVPRDTINVAALAAQNAGSEAVTINDISAASRRWFLNDKESQVRSDPATRRVLQGLRTYAQRNLRRGFLLDRHYEAQAPEIQDLYDSRILHQVAMGVGPGAGYTAYLIDFGLYADIVSDADRLRTWKDNWLSNWRDFDPNKAAEVRRAVLTLEQLRKSA